MNEDEQIEEEEKALKSVERDLRKLRRMMAGRNGLQPKNGYHLAEDALEQIKWFREVRMRRVIYRKPVEFIIADNLMSIWMPQTKKDAVLLDQVTKEIVKELDDNERR